MENVKKLISELAILSLLFIIPSALAIPPFPRRKRLPTITIELSEEQKTIDLAVERGEKFLKDLESPGHGKVRFDLIVGILRLQEQAIDTLNVNRRPGEYFMPAMYTYKYGKLESMKNAIRQNHDMLKPHASKEVKELLDMEEIGEEKNMLQEEKAREKETFEKQLGEAIARSPRMQRRLHRLELERQRRETATSNSGE